MTNLEKLEAFLGKEQSDRLLEVLSVLLYKNNLLMENSPEIYL